MDDFQVANPQGPPWGLREGVSTMPAPVPGTDEILRKGILSPSKLSAVRNEFKIGKN